jgi:regulator of protease activity HflC (stomatin/prohibitin superfamily)
VYSRISGLDDRSNLREGINFVVPWFQRPIIYDIRTRPTMIQTQSGSKGNVSKQYSSITNQIVFVKDLQQVQISLRVLYRPNPNELAFVYRRLGTGQCESI